MTDKTSLFKISYGLYVLTTKFCGRDNGCIINTPVQVADNPLLITISINKQNYSTEVLQQTGECNLSVLAKSVPFSVFENFGFKSGRDTDKLAGVDISRTENGLCYLNQFTNAVISLKVISNRDLGSHIEFLCEVTEAKVLSDEESVTYADYHKNIKPKPQKKTKGYRCVICGYVHESDTLPDDFVCPICKHGAEAFVKIED
ncbi:MAG: flavin reductase [Oscillospiraceae bacterium]|jgi:flavin reductase (DIM6/NTAB) family NADH-FMN oxidoreductase RutF|nr:flavin reductase [Oscillospiraceae bacterium]